MTDSIHLGPAAQAVLNAYRDFSWTPDEEDNGRYYKFSHKAGMAAALRAAADQVVPEERRPSRRGVRPGGTGALTPEEGAEDQRAATRRRLCAIAAELEGDQ